MKSDRDKEFEGFVRSKLEGIHSPDTFDEQWERMEAALDKKNSRKFYFYRFNIVYVLLLLTGVSVIFWSLFLRKDDKGKVDDGGGNSNEIQIVPTPVLKENDSVFFQERKENKSEPKKKERMVKDSIGVSQIEKEDVKDTVKYMSTPPPPIQTTVSSPDSVVKPKVKKIKYVTKRDTIIQVDTTRIKRKR
jgi:hypothetical protein